jgi:hypothetical protein
MRYAISLIWLMIFLFTFSCKGQNNDLKGDLVNNQIDMSEAKRTKHRELALISKGSHNYIPGVILIKFKDGTDVQSIKTIQKRLGLKTIKVVPKLNIYHMKIQNGSSVEEVMKRLQSFLEVEYSEPNYIVDFQ